MEENKKFRNHISIVFERLGSGMFIFISALVWGFIDSLEEMWTDVKNLGTEMQDGNAMLITCGVMMLLMLILVLWQVLVWYRTFITIQENTIVIEQNTLNKKKNTIGIKNISNINLEQNLFELILGTCKVKLDTNSLSTADKTDVKIVLKKKEAELFRYQIIQIQNKEKGHPQKEMLQGVTQSKGADVVEIVVHGLLSVRWLSVLLAIGSIVGAINVVIDLVKQGDVETAFLGAASVVLVSLSVFVSSAWDILKGFIQYYEFHAERREDKIYLHYGLLKKVDYTVPIDKINAVKLIQSPQARIFRMYMAELINVGMNDDEKESRAFFLLYGKKEKIQEQMKILLPEFADCMEMKVNHQPKCVWAVWSLSGIIFTVIMGMVILMGNQYFKEDIKWIILAVLGIAACFLLVKVFEYKTDGSYIDNRFLHIVNGHFGRKCIVVKYDKIQYIEGKQNFIAKYFQMQKAKIYLLAGSMERAQELPYISENEFEHLAVKLKNSVV